MHLQCPNCDVILDRNAMIVSLYSSGFSYRDLGRVFRMSHGGIRYIVINWSRKT